MSGGVSDSCNRASVAVVVEVTAAGRRVRPAGVCAGTGGHRSQSSDAVSRLVPQQTPL